VLHKGRPGEVYDIDGRTELTNRDLTATLLAAVCTGWDRDHREWWEPLTHRAALPA
jgi:dTDP-D-glucose 4,6-dehydratase